MVCWPWYPRPPKNHLAKKQVRDPFECVYVSVTVCVILYVLHAASMCLSRRVCAKGGEQRAREQTEIRTKGERESEIPKNLDKKNKGTRKTPRKIGNYENKDTQNRKRKKQNQHRERYSGTTDDTQKKKGHKTGRLVM